MVSYSTKSNRAVSRPKILSTNAAATDRLVLTMELAEYVPLDCPPKSAKPTNGVLFRMARKIPIADSEFVP